MLLVFSHFTFSLSLVHSFCFFIHSVSPRLLHFVCFESHNSLYLHAFVIYLHNFNLRLIIQLFCPLLESTALFFYSIPQFWFSIFRSCFFSTKFHPTFSSSFFILLIRFLPFMSFFAFSKLFITLSSFFSDLYIIWRYS